MRTTFLYTAPVCCSATPLPHQMYKQIPIYTPLGPSTPHVKLISTSANRARIYSLDNAPLTAQDHGYLGLSFIAVLPVSCVRIQGFPYCPPLLLAGSQIRVTPS